MPSFCYKIIYSAFTLFISGIPVHLGKISGRPKADVKFENGHRGVYMLEFAELQRVPFDEVGD